MNIITEARACILYIFFVIIGSLKYVIDHRLGTNHIIDSIIYNVTLCILWRENKRFIIC